MTSGRPLRFLRRVLGGWIAARLLIAGLPLLLPILSPGSGRAPAAYAAIREVFPIGEALQPPLALARMAGGHIVAALPHFVTGADRTEPPPSATFQGGWGGADAMLAASLGFIHPDDGGGAHDFARFAPGNVSRPPAEAALAAPAVAPAGDGRWRGSAWTFWRGGGDAPVAGGGQLGGSQAGIRIDRAIGRIGGGAAGVYGRASAALDQPHAGEAALGLAWSPARGLPVTVAIERRQRIGAGGRSAFAAYVAGGLDPTDIGAELMLEGYGQAGIVGFARPDAFVDGALSLTRSLTAPDAERGIAVGASISGGAQPGAARLDVGPQVQMRLPLGRDRARLSAEWRERIAGAALPASGPAVTLIGEF